MAKTTTSTRTRYRLIWGETKGVMLHGDNLDYLLRLMSPEHGDRIQCQTITTTETDWNDI